MDRTKEEEEEREREKRGQSAAGRYVQLLGMDVVPTSTLHNQEWNFTIL